MRRNGRVGAAVLVAILILGLGGAIAYLTFKPEGGSAPEGPRPTGAASEEGELPSGAAPSKAAPAGIGAAAPGNEPGAAKKKPGPKDPDFVPTVDPEPINKPKKDDKAPKGDPEPLPPK